MDGAAAGKVCGICGEDCSGRPRTKDANGRYFCRPCYDQAAERKRPKPAPNDQRPSPKVAPKPVHQLKGADSMEPAGAGLRGEDDVNPLLALLDEQSTAPPPVMAARQCASCGAALANDAVICVNCGLNTQTAQQTKPKVIKAKRAAPGTERATMWPTVIGIISILLGLPGVVVLIFTIFAVMNAELPAGTPTIARYLGLAVAALPGLMATWLVIAGLGVLRRREESFRQLRRWSILTTIMGVLLGAILIAAAGSGIGNARVQGRAESVLQMATVGTLALIVLTSLAWPVFVLIWTMRPAIREEASKW